MLDDALQQGVRGVGVARPEQHQVGQHPRQPPVAAILERVDGEGDDAEHSGSEKGVEDGDLPLPSITKRGAFT